jgi:hypothetical protein
LYFVGPRYPSADRFAVPLVLAIGLSGALAQWRTLEDFAWVSAFIASGALLAIALRPVSTSENPQSGRALAASAAPLLVALWVGRVAHFTPGSEWQFPMAVAAAFAVGVLLLGYRAESRSARWFNDVTDIFAVALTFVLAASAVFDIERVASAIVLELICVAALVLVASWNGDRVRVGHWIIPATVIGVALVLQANLLRWLGPPGDLDALDVTRMNWPTLVSLLWASIGAGLTIWGRRVGSRVQWSAGAAFLVGAAIKLLLLDFGSLGQLANILAVIAAGGVFLLVGWLAPMPPAAEKTAPAATAAAAVERVEGSSSKLAWTVAIVAIVLITASQCGSRHARDFGFAVAPPEVIAPPPVVESDSQGATSANAAAVSSNPWLDEHIAAMVERGSLRRATMDDYERWVDEGGDAPRRPVIEDPYQAKTSGRFLLNVYIVQAPIHLSEPLYGPRAVTLIVPRGVARPTGDPGHSEILDMNR